MCIARRRAKSVAVGVAFVMAGLAGLPANAGDFAPAFEQFEEVERPEGYSLGDIYPSPNERWAVAQAAPDWRLLPELEEVTGSRASAMHLLGDVLLLLNEDGEPELEIGPATFQLDISSEVPVRWLPEGDSFVFVATFAYEPDPDVQAELRQIERQMRALEQQVPDQDGEWGPEEAERMYELRVRQFELNQEENRQRDQVETTTLFLCDAESTEVTGLWNIGARVLDVDVGSDNSIHIVQAPGPTRPDDGFRIYVLKPEDGPGSSYGVAEVHELDKVRQAPFEGQPHLDADSQTSWQSVSSETGTTTPGIGRMSYGPEAEELEVDVLIDSARVVDLAPCGAALLGKAIDPEQRRERYFVYDTESGEQREVPSKNELADLPELGYGEAVSLAAGGNVVRYRGELGNRSQDIIETWRNAVLLEYTLPEE